VQRRTVPGTPKVGGNPLAGGHPIT